MRVLDKIASDNVMNHVANDILKLADPVGSAHLNVLQFDLHLDRVDRLVSALEYVLKNADVDMGTEVNTILGVGTDAKALRIWGSSIYSK